MVTLKHSGFLKDVETALDVKQFQGCEDQIRVFRGGKGQGQDALPRLNPQETS